MADFGGRYRKLTPLGRGGFGEVWLAEDPRLGNRQVAIKVMRPNVQDALGLARFQRELALTAQMRHPNIVTVFDTGTDNGMPFMVMEYLDGDNLREKWPAGALYGAEAARIGREVCAALWHAHGQDPPVVHRDIKPENIFVCRDGLVKVTDFGIATAATGSRLTQAGYLIGTPAYMAPEVLLDELASPSSDIWAVGCVLYELISGKRPYEYTARGVGIPPLTATPNVPAWLGDAVMKMLRPYPGDRPTAAECIQLLTEPPSRPPTTVAPGPPTTPVPQPVTPPAELPARPQGPLSQPGPLAPRNPPSRMSRPPTRLPGPAVDTAPRGAAPTSAIRRRRKLLQSLVAGAAVIAAAGGATAWFLGRPTWIPDTGTMYVTSSEGIVPVNLATGQIGSPIAVGGSAYGIALSPQGDEAYVVDQTTCQDCSGTVGISSLLPVSLSGGPAGKATFLIQGSPGTGGQAFQVVMSPDGRTAYVMTANGVIPVNVTTGHKGTTIKVGDAQSPIAISPSGGTLYVTSSDGKDLFPVNVVTGAIGNPVKVGSTIMAIAVAPNGGSIYVYDAGGIASVNPASGRINWRASSPELGDGGATGGSLVITPSAQEAYAGGAGTGVVPINLRTHQVGPMLDVGEAISSMAMSRDGKVLYVGGLSGAVYPISVAANQVGKSVSIGGDLEVIAIAS